MKKFFTFRTAVLSLLIGSTFYLASFVAEVFRGFYPDLLPLAHTANSLAIISSIFCIPILAGFFILGEKVKNKLIKYSSMAAIVSTCFIISTALYMLANPSSYIYGNYLVSISLMELTGILLILFGLGCLEAKDKIGRYSMACGILNILIGLSFIFIITVYLGLLLLPPLAFLEAFILSDAAKKYES